MLDASILLEVWQLVYLILEEGYPFICLRILDEEEGLNSLAEEGILRPLTVHILDISYQAEITVDFFTVLNLILSDLLLHFSQELVILVVSMGLSEHDHGVDNLLLVNWSKHTSEQVNSKDRTYEAFDDGIHLSL